MKEKIAKLVDVKSLVTLLLTGTFVYLSIKNKISINKKFKLIYLKLKYLILNIVCKIYGYMQKNIGQRPMLYLS